MLPATAEYIAYETQPRGTTPVVRATFLPYLWPTGVNADGQFNECAYVAPDRVQADYHGFSGGYWISPVLTSNLQVLTASFVITWNYNYPGFDAVMYWRAADDPAALAAAAWVEVNQGDTLLMKPFYQFELTLEGYRAWAVDDIGDSDDFTANAVDSAPDDYLSYAGDDHVLGDPRTYIEALQLLGEFSVMRDIEQAGRVSMEVPVDFSDLVAGSHSGLLLNNRQGSFVDGVWVPAPRYSSNKNSFFMANQDWFGVQLKIELGWSKGGWLRAGHLEAEWLSQANSDFIILFLGKVKKWGPISRAVDADGAQQPNTVEVYAEDWTMDCLQKRIALPAADGSPSPKIYGEFLCKADLVSGWSPAAILRSAYFEQENYNELDHVVAVGGGAFSLITPGLVGPRSFRTQVTGMNQSAYGSMELSSTGVFLTGMMQFTAAPVTQSNANLTFLQVIGAGGVVRFAATIDASGAIYSSTGGQSNFNILAYLGVPLSFALWFSPVTDGYIKLFINGDEVLAYRADLSGTNPAEIRFGAITGGVSETWTIDWSNFDLRSAYYNNAFKVEGGPFASMGPVYIDNIAQPDSKTVGGFTQTLTRLPAYGMVQFGSTDPDFDPPGDVLVRVVEHAGGRHPLEVIELLLADAGLTDYVDAAALAAAYAACPNDVIHAKFEGGGDRGDRRGLKDVASMGMTIGDALREICSRCLYWIFTDAGKIKIVSYTGLMPAADPVLAFTASNKWENPQTFDLEAINDFVTATYGWYERNPALFYVAGSQAAGGQGTGLDYTWDSPVATESHPMVKAKADLLLQFLSAQERIEPVRTSLMAARVEGMDIVSLEDVLLNDAVVKYWVTGKDIGLDQGRRETSLQLMRYLGDS